MVQLTISLGAESCVRKFKVTGNITREEILTKAKKAYTSVIHMGGSISIA